MKGTANRIKKENPYVDEGVLTIADELDEKKALSAYADTDGGKLLRKAATRDVLRLVNRLAYEHGALEHVQLISLCASLRASLSILQVLNGAKANAERAQKDLEDALA